MIAAVVAPAGWGLDPLLWWALLGALGALLALDEHALAQTWLSQPLPACLLAGLLAGDAGAGLAAGLLLQLALIGNLPVGASHPVDSVTAAVGVTAGAVLAGWQPPALQVLGSSQADPRLASWGMLLAMTAAAGLLGGQVVKLERTAALARMLDGYRSVRDGDLRRIERLHGRSLLVTGLRGAGLTVVWSLVAWQMLPLGIGRLPAQAMQALGLLPLLVPLLAAGSLLERFGPRQALPLVGAGALAAFLMVRFLS